MKNSREILKRTESKMKERSKESEQQSTANHNYTAPRVDRQHTHTARGKATRTRSQSQTHMISLEYLSTTRNSLTRYAGPFQYRRTEIIKPNDLKASCP